jgi:hypothetical protein
VWSVVVDDMDMPNFVFAPVYGDPLSSPATLLTSLLLDPLSEDSATYDAIMTRHDEGGKKSKLIISARSDSRVEMGATVKRDVGSLEGEIGWLKESGMQVMEVLGALLPVYPLGFKSLRLTFHGDGKKKHPPQMNILQPFSPNCYPRISLP